MPESETGFLSLATSRAVVISSLKVALVVGSILALINHGGAILQLALSSENVLQILLTYMVPYSVSTFSSVKALQRHTQEHSD